MNLYIFLILTTLFAFNCDAAEEKAELQKEKVPDQLTKSEVSTTPPKAKDQQKEAKKEEEPFSSQEINVEEFKNGSFANVSDCLYFYQRGGVAVLKSLNASNPAVHHLTFEHKPIKSKGSCTKNSTSHQTFISLRFALVNGTESADKLKVNASFIKNKKGYWEMEYMFAKVNKINKEFKFNCKHLETPIEFSYSCKNFSIEAEKGDQKLVLKLFNLQIQPFYNKRVFAESFDCSTLFTLGTWMGLIVVWIFTAVIAIGIYSIISIKTMDRFDTKGKALSLGTIDQ